MPGSLGERHAGRLFRGRVVLRSERNGSRWTERLSKFAEHYRTIARPFDWTFTRNDLNQVLAKIADREPDLRLAA